jgi:3-phosphoshikimate 1-carboxyvinyltransferase
MRVPGDKSISHRAVMLGAIAEGTTEVEGFLEGADCLATLQAFREMGVQIEYLPGERLIIHGVGLHGLQSPSAILDLGNSGTSIRLLAGLLAGQKFSSCLTGDASLCRRPMKRLVDPLTRMGAHIAMQVGGFPPLAIYPVKALQNIQYEMPVASAQVKSSLLLAGLYAQGEIIITEPAPTRDHTERMLQTFGCTLHREQNTIRFQGEQSLRATHLKVPADISSAAFFMVGAAIAPSGSIILEEVGVNPTRTGVIDILCLMGADITLLNQRWLGGEPIADIKITSSPLKGINIPAELVPLAIDEFPAIFIAAACAEGKTQVTGAEELRVKESDRIQSMVDGLVALGISAEALPDGAIITGGKIKGGIVNSHGDHRIAMAFTLASLRAAEEILITDCANIATSFPNFTELVSNAGVQLIQE